MFKHEFTLVKNNAYKRMIICNYKCDILPTVIEADKSWQGESEDRQFQGYSVYSAIKVTM